MRQPPHLSVKRPTSATARWRRLLVGALAIAASAITPVPRAAAGDIALDAVYYITLAGFTIGRVNVDAAFTDNDYIAAIEGETYGWGRIVSDSQATLIGNGRIRGQKVVPAAYTLATRESGFETHVNMAMRGGAIARLVAEPSLIDAPDRIPLTARDKRRVVDPVGALVVALGRSEEVTGARACDRTVPVFDGWQRFDVSLFFKSVRTVNGRGNSYAGDVFVCGAHYVPVAGHRESRQSVQYLAENKRLEVWLIPLAGTDLMLPYRIQIGTEIGDLVVVARDFVVTPRERHASAD